MANPKIVHFTTSLKRGGAELVLSSIVQGLQNSFDQTVLYIHDGPYRSVIEQLGVECIPIRGVLNTYDPVFLVRLYRAMRVLRPDVLHTLLWSANVAGRVVGTLLSVPVVSVYHSNVDQDGYIRNMLDRATIMLATKNCAVSSGVVRSIHTLGIQEQLEIITNGIDCTPGHDGKRLKKRSDIGLQEDHFVVGAVGRLVSIKNFDRLIDACALLAHAYPRLRLCMIGVGPELTALQGRVSRYGLSDRVQFLVDVPAIEYYHLFDCFVLPSLREGISMALLEALREQVPAVVVCDEEHPVIHHDTNGMVVPHAQAMLIAQAIKRLIEFPEHAKQLGVAGRETVVRSFNRNKMLAQYCQLFHAAMRE